MKSLLLAAAIVVSAPALAQSVDIAKLKAAAALPSIKVEVDFGFVARRHLELGDRRDAPARIAELQRDVAAKPTDADLWWRLGTLYADVSDTQRSQEAYEKAIRLLEKQQASRPDDPKVLSRLGDSLRAVGREAEAEAVLRSASRRAGKEWLVWTSLADLLDSKAWKRLALTSEEMDKLLAASSEERSTLLTGAFKQRLTPAAIAEAKRLSAEAQTCYNRAVEAAPSAPEPYLARAGARMLQSTGIPALLLFLSPPKPGDDKVGAQLLSSAASPAVIDDLRRARRLAADSAETITTTATMESIWALLGSGQPLEGLGEEDGFERLPTTAKQPILEAMTRLVELTASPKNAIQAAAFEGLGILAFLRGQKAKMEDHLRTAASLRPLNARANELLTMAYLANGRMDDLAQLFETRIQREDNARNRFILAKAQVRRGKADSAELHLNAGLQTATDDFWCRLGLAALRLRAGDVSGAKPHLESVAAQARAGKLTGGQRAEWLALEAVREGLAGKVDDARALLKLAREADEGNEALPEIAAALGGG